jgi:hypothetical protein
MRAVPHHCLALALTALVAVGWPAETAAAPAACGTVIETGISGTTSTVPCPSGGPTSNHGKSSLGGVIGAIAGAVIIGGIIASQSKAAAPAPPSPPPSYDDLIANGPTMAAIRPVHAFAIYGIVRDGSPIGLEYSTAYDADVTLTIKDGDHSWTHKLDPGPHSVTLAYDVSGWRGSDVGLFTVEAKTHGKPSAVEVYGIGAGASSVSPFAVNDRDPAPRLATALDYAGGWTGTGERLFKVSTFALAQSPATGGDGGTSGGAVAINSLSFGPPTLQAHKGAASFSYMRTVAFERVVTEVLIYPKPKLSPSGDMYIIDVKPIWRAPPTPVLSKGSSGTWAWPGLDNDKQVSMGMHRLQVRGWMHTRDQGWVAALSQQTVDVQ